MIPEITDMELIGESDLVRKIYDKYYPADQIPGLRALLITHSRKVRDKALAIAGECDLGSRIDTDFLADAAMLHDIGIKFTKAEEILCYGEKPYICHGIEGEVLLKSEGLSPRYGRVCARHTGAGLTAGEIIEAGLPLPHVDLVPETIEEKLICYADKFYSKSGDPTKEKSLEKVILSMRRHGSEVERRFMEMHRMFSAGPFKSRSAK